MADPPKPKGDADGSAHKKAAPPPAGLGFGAPPPPAGSKAPPVPPPAAERDPVDALFRISAPPVVPPRTLQARHRVSVDVEPVAALFGVDQIMPAPSLPPEPNEAELGRMQATGRTSVFGDLVRDPPPPPELAVPRAPRVPVVAEEPELEAEPEPAPSATKSGAHKPSAPPPVPAAAAGKKKARKPQPPPTPDKDSEPAAAAPAAATAAAPPRAAARSILLAVVGALVVVTLGVLFGVIPNPLASAPIAPIMEPPPRPAPPPPIAKPAPQVAPQAPTAAPTPPSPAPSSPAPVAAPVAAAPAQAPAQQPPEPAAAPAAKPAPAPVATAAKASATEPSKPAAEPAKPPPVVTPSEPAPAPKPAADVEGSAAGTAALVAAARKKLAEDEPKAAETLLRQALAADPEDHHVMEMLARALMDQERGQEALVFARKIVQRRPRRAPYRLLLGDLLLMVGDEAGAKAEWQKALALTPDDPQIKRRLGM